MLDLRLDNARTLDDPEPHRIGVRAGRITTDVATSREVIDLGGRLVTPPLVEPHIHLDALRLISPRYLVLRAGKVVVRTEPARTTVSWAGSTRTVDYLRP